MSWWRRSAPLLPCPESDVLPSKVVEHCTAGLHEWHGAAAHNYTRQLLGTQPSPPHLLPTCVSPHPAHIASPPPQVDKDLRQMLLRPDAPAPRKVAVRVWPRAIPQVIHVCWLLLPCLVGHVWQAYAWPRVLRMGPFLQQIYKLKLDFPSPARSSTSATLRQWKVRSAASRPPAGTACCWAATTWRAWRWASEWTRLLRFCCCACAAVLVLCMTCVQLGSLALGK